MDRLARKAVDRGRKAFKDGLPIEKNPFLYSGAGKGLSAWWDKGWTEASRANEKTAEKINL